jgi:hypothetical protein
MPLLGKAVLAMWWDVAADVRPEWEHWHAHEHFPERLAIPGFLRARRWTDAAGGEGAFVMYELHDHAVLASAPYLARLNAPSAWSTRMMPLHRNMVRTQCRLLQSHGAVTARHVLTIRCSPADGQAEALQGGLSALAARVCLLPGIVGMHLLRHEAPPLAVTTEQQIRGNADRAADWVLVASGYELAALRHLADVELGDAGLHALGAAPEAGRHRQIYALAYSATPGDVH